MANAMVSARFGGICHTAMREHWRACGGAGLTRPSIRDFDQAICLAAACRAILASFERVVALATTRPTSVRISVATSLASGPDRPNPAVISSAQTGLMICDLTGSASAGLEVAAFAGLVVDTGVVDTGLPAGISGLVFMVVCLWLSVCGCLFVVVVSAVSGPRFVFARHGKFRSTAIFRCGTELPDAA